MRAIVPLQVSSCRNTRHGEAAVVMLRTENDPEVVFELRWEQGQTMVAVVDGGPPLEDPIAASTGRPTAAR